MKITHVKIKIKDLVDGFISDEETGRVSGYGGRLDIRPAYQREFVYKDKQREAVIDTINKKFPLNTIYWAKKDDGTFEVLDGQQRTISICQYYTNVFSLEYRGYNNLLPEEQEKFLDYEIDVYQCEGTVAEKLDWFRVINIAGEKLTDQELKNAVYSGPWLSDAKHRFSARNCTAERIAADYMVGSPIRQDYLEKVLTWISEKENICVDEYMAKHQHDANAGELWSYFSAIFEWVKTIFPDYKREMKGVEWGLLYNEFGTTYPDANELMQKIQVLLIDEDVTNKKGIYPYVLSGREKHLSIRTFSNGTKREVYERQNHKCPHCIEAGVDKEWDITEMDADHINPWHSGGKTVAENCQLLCKTHNRQKSGK